MYIYTTKTNVWEAISGLVRKDKLSSATEEIYEFAKQCHENKTYTERAGVFLTRKYVAKDTEEAFRELWAVISAFAFEGLANSCVWKLSKNPENNDELKNVAMAALIASGRKYNFDNDFRRSYELTQDVLTAKLYPEASKLITYATTAITNEICRTIRRMNPIPIPDHLATCIALIKKVLNEYGVEVSDEEILNIIQDDIRVSKNLPRNHDKRIAVINYLRQAVIANESLTEYDLEWVLDTLESDENIPESVIESEVATSISEKLAKVTAEVYGYESGFIMQMLHSSLELTGKAMSTYDMVEPMVEFRLTSHYVDRAVGGEAIADTIKMAMVKNGIEDAHKDLNDMETFHLNNAIMNAKSDKERIDRGELTEAMVVGSTTKQGSINYKFRSMYPIKPIVASDKALYNHKAYCNALCDIGLDSFANAIKAHVINY
jgi:hypothetical protein